MIRLTSGSHLVQSADGAWYCAAPGDRFVRVEGDARVVGLARDLAAGLRPGADDASLAALGELDTLLQRAGLAQPWEAPEAEPVTVDIVVEGTGPIAEEVARLLASERVRRTDTVDEDQVATCDVLVTCAGWLPDARWRQVDDWCAVHRTTWVRTYAEGDRWVVGPTFDARSALPVRYVDVRARRLAASPVADHLLDLWRAHEDAPAPPVPWPDPVGSAFVAALVAREVTADGPDRPMPAVQRLVTTTSGRVEEHPVLPLPRDVIS